MKILDCITFFRENFITNLRFEILKDYVDCFVICESIYDHKGRKKEINFKLKNLSLKNKIIHIILDHPFPESDDPWKCQAYQRDFMLKNLTFAKEDDYIMFSDPDEIPNPNILKNISLQKKYGIFLQKSYVYKLNIFNQFETPWEGTRICKKKNLKSIDFMRQKVLLKNLKKWWRFDKEKNIEVYKNGGWHFNNCFSPEEISIKLKSFAHSEFSEDKFSNINVIKEKIQKKSDLFGRGWNFVRVKIDNTFPEYIFNNLEILKNHID